MIYLYDKIYQIRKLINLVYKILLLKKSLKRRELLRYPTKKFQEIAQFSNFHYNCSPFY